MMEIYIIGLLCVVSFFAGFVDAIVGGGGLIQTPFTMILLPQLSVANVIGTLKIPAFSGTSFAAVQYLKRVTIINKWLFLMALISFSSAFFGSWLLTVVSNDFMKPVLFVVLIGIAVYTFKKKSFGQQFQKQITPKKSLFGAIMLSLGIGFYDGFIGPGTGSLLVLGFISWMGFDFLHASANAKMINLATNFGSICLFICKGKIIWIIAIPMACCNAIGGFLGARIAIRKGNSFIRTFFLFVVVFTLIRFGYDIFRN